MVGLHRPLVNDVGGWRSDLIGRKRRGLPVGIGAGTV